MVKRFQDWLEVHGTVNGSSWYWKVFIPVQLQGRLYHFNLVFESPWAFPLSGCSQDGMF